MLTVDHIKLRRRKGIVDVVPLCGLDDARALELADVALEIGRAHEGEARATLEDALDELPVVQDKKGGDELRFGRGLKKLVLDACTFDVDTALDPEAVRAEVFSAAAAARSASTFDRANVLGAVAAARSVSTDDVERALYADLNAAHAVRGLEIPTPAALVERYRVAELQAVLLRALRVTFDVDASALELRALLRAVKLHQLLYELEESAGESVRLVVEGPMGLFQQSTRYGLKLALLLPHVLACKRWSLEASVRLNKGAPETLKLAGARQIDAPAPALPELAAALVDEVKALAGRWHASPSGDVLRHPGAGAFVPDVKLENTETGELVYVEILGFWSRAAVWKRVELVDKGLPFRVVFCASERLRVSEQALADDAGSALVLFKGTLRAQKVLEAADRVTR